MPPGYLGLIWAVALELAPVRRDAFAALLCQLVCVGSKKDRRGDRASKVSPVFHAKRGGQLIDSCEPILGHALHHTAHQPRVAPE